MLSYFNQLDKKTKSNMKKIIFTAICVFIILIISLVIYYAVNGRNKSDIISLESFTSVEDVVKYMGCEYYGTKKDVANSFRNVVNLKFKVKPIENNISYENFYNNLILAVANVLKYTNFVLNDDENSIVITVTCDENVRRIKEVKINGETNYFKNETSKLNLQNFTSINNVNVNVQSAILVSLINNQFKYDDKLFGTKESTLDDYDIYFDEGIRVRNIDNKIFNIVFTNKYKDSIINNITVGKSFEDIEKILGQPTFTDDYFIGYKTDKFYIFFLENQISIYRNESVDTTEFANIISKFLTEKNSNNLANSLIKIWPDFDEIKMEGKTINLKYSLKGVNIQFNYMLNHGVHIYNNFKGKITDNLTIDSLIQNPQNLPENIYIESEDLVYKNEYQRAYSFHNLDYFYPQFKFLAQETETITKNGGNIDSSVSLKDDSGKYVYYEGAVADYEDSSIYIISNDDNNPSSQILSNCDSHLWISEDILAYSVSKNGIYLYNAKDFTTKELIKGNNNFNIKSYENGVLKYDNTQVNVNI